MKNITFSADEALIQKAREKAKRENSSLNQRFREWLESYIAQDSISEEYTLLMESMSQYDAGKKFSREEMNER